MVKTGIPVPVFYTFFGIGIVFSIGLIIYMAKHQTHSNLTKNIVIWFALLMIINLVNLIFTFVYYEQKKTIIGQEGNKGRRGPRGFSGENMKCGNKLCGDFGKNECNPDEKDKEGKCIYSGGTVDENGKERSSESNIQIGMCKFPFVYNYKNQYGCINQDHPDYPKEEADRLGLPKGGEQEGLCATDLNPNNTARTWGFCTGNSMRAKEFSYTNRKGNENERLQEKQSGIVDLTIVHGDTDKEAKCPKGYRKIEGDLNKGAGAYVYMCAKDGMGNVGVTKIDVVEGNDNCSKVFPQFKKNELTKLTTNLNKDTDIGTSDPQELYMCILKQKGSRDFITDIKVHENEKWNEGTTTTHYQKIKGDLNKDTGGSPVFIFTTTTNREINPLKSAFYIPDTRVLHFSMGNSGEDFYLYNEDENKVGDKDRVSNIMGVIPKNYEAIAYLNDSVYVFKGSLVYEVDFELKKIKVGYPKKIKTLFPQIPNNIDAAYINPNDTDAYFFKDKLVYRFRLIKSNPGNALGKLVERYPKNINQIFAGAPNYPDAVFTVPDEKEKNYTYIASATSFRVFDEDNILVRTDTIDLDTRFGLKTNSGFKTTNIKNNTTATANSTATAKETFANKNNKPEPEPWKGCKDKEFASMDEGTCPVSGANRDAKSGTSFGSNIGSSPLSPS